MKVNYDGDIFHVTAEMPERMFHMRTDNINELKKHFLLNLSEAFDEAVYESNQNRYLNHTNFEKNKKEIMDIQKAVIGKYYNLEVIQSNRYLELTQKASPCELRGITLKRYENVELMSINGLGNGQVHFLTESGEYLLLPWCYIISMVPNKNKE